MTDVRDIQRAMAARGLYAGAIDNDFGPKSRKGFKEFMRTAAPARLSEAQITAAAKAFDLPASVVGAVYDVEASGAGFESGLMKIRREAHHFQRLSKGRFDASHPHLSHAYAVRARWPQPSDQAGRWEQLMDMIALDADAALQSFSWGAFQVMGFNFAALDKPDAWSLVQWLNQGEARHLDGFFLFSQANGIMDDWRAKRFLAAATVYNGQANARVYADKLDAADRRRGGR